jgi:hypothetical protein
MWTALDVTRILRRELDYPRILVRLTPYRDPNDRRWEVCEIRRRYFGPFQAGGFRFKEARDFADPFYVHEGPGGEYLPLDPHLILAAVRQQDGWLYQNRPTSMVQRVRDAERRRLASQSAMFEDIAVDTRRMVAQAADEMGL